MYINDNYFYKKSFQHLRNAFEFYENNPQKPSTLVHMHYKFTSYEELYKPKVYNNSLETEFTQQI
jgi:hypothetical protein